jgi:hypothetical protein
MALYIHSLIRLHGAVLKYLSTGTTLPFYSNQNSYGVLPTDAQNRTPTGLSRPECAGHYHPVLPLRMSRIHGTVRRHEDTSLWDLVEISPSPYKIVDK